MKRYLLVHLSIHLGDNFCLTVNGRYAKKKIRILCFAISFFKNPIIGELFRWEKSTANTNNKIEFVNLITDVHFNAIEPNASNEYDLLND